MTIRKIDALIKAKSVDIPVKNRDTARMAQVEVTAEALEQFSKLPRVIKERVRKLLHRLQDWPKVSGAKPLSGELAGWYRLRTGDYRVRFRVKGDTVTVDKIGHRSDFYED